MTALSLYSGGCDGLSLAAVAELEGRFPMKSMLDRMVETIKKIQRT